MSTADSTRSRPGRWSTRDLLVVAAIAVAMLLVIVPVTYLTTAVQTTAPVAVMWTFGVWLLPAFMALALTHRAGAGVVAMLIAGLVQAPVVPFGWAAVAFMLMLAVPVELTFAITRYRRWGTTLFVVGGAVTGVLFLPMAWVPYDLMSLSIGVQIFAGLSQVISGAVAGAAGAWLVGRLATAGIASGASADRPSRRTTDRATPPTGETSS
jgi:energy-coupling factor transport system substrate-specific component